MRQGLDASPFLIPSFLRVSAPPRDTFLIPSWYESGKGLTRRREDAKVVGEVERSKSRNLAEDSCSLAHSLAPTPNPFFSPRLRDSACHLPYPGLVRIRERAHAKARRREDCWESWLPADNRINSPGERLPLPCREMRKVRLERPNEIL